ncbi:MAG: RdgB/HAM1 family non-canonical purine NTP pyrophosphatase [Acidobacteriota bacterium]
MADLLVATTNRGKVGEIKAVLTQAVPDIKLFTPNDLNITDVPEETGDTFLENSVEKSLFYSRLRNGMLTIADDSGLEVDSLGGSPGVQSARYGGPESNDNKNVSKLLTEMEGMEKRSARFVSVITLSLNGSVIRSFRGEVSGVIINERKGMNGFGYDPVFFYPPLQRTFAELPAEEKNRISHRAVALKQLRDFILENKGLVENG